MKNTVKMSIMNEAERLAFLQNRMKVDKKEYDALKKSIDTFMGDELVLNAGKVTITKLKVPTKRLDQDLLISKIGITLFDSCRTAASHFRWNIVTA